MFSSSSKVVGKIRLILQQMPIGAELFVIDREACEKPADLSDPAAVVELIRNLVVFVLGCFIELLKRFDVHVKTVTARRPCSAYGNAVDHAVLFVQAGGIELVSKNDDQILTVKRSEGFPMLSNENSMICKHDFLRDSKSVDQVASRLSGSALGKFFFPVPSFKRSTCNRGHKRRRRILTVFQFGYSGGDVGIGFHHGGVELLLEGFHLGGEIV